MNNTKSEILDPVDISCFKPTSPENSVYRDSLISGIELKIENGFPIVLISGQTGIGKSTALGQFLIKYKKDVIAVFIDTTKKYAHNIEAFVIDLYCQVYFHINSEIPSNNISPSKMDLSTLFQKLQYDLKRRKRKFYLVVDGLGELFTEEAGLAEELLGCLPFNLDSLTFLLSDQDGNIKKHIKARKYCEVEVTPMSEYEACQLLSDVAPSDVKKIIEVYRAIPEKLAMINRLLKGGSTIDNILQNYSSEECAGLVQAEWERSLKYLQGNEMLFSIIFFSQGSISIDVLAQATELSSEAISEVIKKVSYIEIVEGNLLCHSEALKQYARNELSGLKKEAIQKLVSILGSEKRNLSSISEYYGSIGEHSAVVGHLDNETIENILESTKSINTVSKQLKIGLESAKLIGSEDKIYKFSQMHTLLNAMTQASPLKNELRCYIEEDNIDKALGFISTSSSIEQKIQLLAILAASQKDRDGYVDPDIEIQVFDLFERIDPEVFGAEFAVDLALELFPAFPDKAMTIINGLDKFGESGGNKSDYAFLRMSVELLRAKDGRIEEFANSLSVVEEKKKDALSMLSLFKKGTPAKKILENLAEREQSDVIFILRKWISAFPDSKESIVLMRDLLRRVLEAQEFHADASLYADVFSALVHLKRDEGLEVLGYLEPQIEEIKRVGPTLDFVRLQLYICQFEANVGIGSNKLAKLMAYIEHDVEDKAVVLSSYCMVCQHSDILTADYPLDYIETLLERAFDTLVQNTADHDSVFREAISLQTVVDPSRAIRWALRFNTETRRDSGVLIVIKELCKSDTSRSIDWMCQQIRNIKDREKVATALIYYLKCLARQDITLSKDNFRRIKKLKRSITDNFLLSRINSLLLNLTKKIESKWTNQTEALIAELHGNVDQIDGEWHKIDICFEIASAINREHQDIAKLFRDRASSIRKESAINNENIAEAFKYSVDICIRMYHFLCQTNLATDKDSNQLQKIIDAIPSKVVKIQQFSRLASVYHLNNNVLFMNHVVENYVIPILDSFENKQSHEYEFCLYWASPILYVYNKNIFETYLRTIKDRYTTTDSVIRFTRLYLIQKFILGDPFEPVKNHDYKIEYKDAEDLLYLINELNQDSAVFVCLMHLIQNITDQGKIRKLTGPQINNIAAKIEAIINSKFCDFKYIRHDGYKIASLALLLKFKGEKSEQAWKELEKKVESDVPVLSDRVFIYGVLAELAHPSLNEFRKHLIRKAVSDIENIPSYVERIQRYEYIAECSYDFDKPYVKHFIKKAILLSAKEDSDDYKRKRKNLIDTIFGIDKDFAKGMSAFFNDDPVRKEIIQDNVNKKIQERKDSEQFDVSSDGIGSSRLSDKYPKLVWSLVAQMNAGNHVPSKKNDYSKYLDSVSNYGAKEAYPLLTYYVHGVGLSSRNRATAEKKLKPLFDSAVSNVELLLKLCQFKSHLDTETDIPRQNQVIVGEDDYEKAEAFVKRVIADCNMEYIEIIDPYFDLESLKFVGSCIDKDPNFKIRILTSFSRKNVVASNGDDVSDALAHYWSENICSGSMPEFTLTFCGLPSLNNDMPIHDRWWLCGDRGLRFGTSLNALGKARITEITYMLNDDVITVQKKVSSFLNAEQREYRGERIKYLTVSA